MRSLITDLRSSNDNTKKKALYEILNMNISKCDDIVLLYSIVKEIENSRSVPLRYFSTRVIDKIEIYAEKRNIDLKENILLDEIEEKDTNEYIEKLNSKSRIERENAIYFLSIRSLNSYVIKKLEDFAEKTESESEALIAIEAIEKIIKRKQKLLKNKIKEEIVETNKKEPEDIELAETKISENENEIIETVFENEKIKERSKKSYSIFSLIIILIVVIVAFIYSVYKNTSYKNISSYRTEKKAPKLINTLLKIRVSNFWELSKEKDYNAIYVEFGFRDLSRYKYIKKYTLKGNDTFKFKDPIIEMKNNRVLVKINAVKDNKNYILSHYWSKLNNKWVPTSKIEIDQKN